MEPQSPPPAPREKQPQRPKNGRRPDNVPRWALWAGLLVILSIFIIPPLFDTDSAEEVTYSEFITRVDRGVVDEVEVNTRNGAVTGRTDDGTRFRTVTQIPLADEDVAALREKGVNVTFTSPEPSILLQFLPLLLLIGVIVVLFIWMQRRAQGQMSGMMSIGRSKAKTYTTERPNTTFDDVAGYEGVKQEITEVVDFLKHPERFAAIGARIPKGVLLVGPPGTGKTLIARAVAGEAGVPFLSVTGSDFMEMFVGVGASRVRDLFQNARKMGSSIVFIDEIDSIGRKRGAGLGGGHDEREQTLNQMLAEMDGFEPAEGVVVMAATNRPDILDSALLRPGRFDRQVVVPLPEASERSAILKVHCKGKRIATDVDLDLIARATPGMSGADLANMVNEAALVAVRRGDTEVRKSDFEVARDRILMGQRRDSMALSDEEKETIAYHEGGHAVLAALMPRADPLHKVTIIPTGMALGVTQQLPEERHIHRQDYLEDSLVVRLGGRIAEELVYGVVSTGANNDLVTATELARKMVREWGMSERVGPMAWGSQGQVFLGEDLMHSREYSDETARIIDEEVERILRAQEERARTTLGENKSGLDSVARALLEHETIDGAEVLRLIEAARGGNGAAATGGDGDRTTVASGDAAEPPAPAPASDGPGADEPAPDEATADERAPAPSPVAERID